MIIYNVTINIDDNVHDDWLKWMKEVHIQDVMDTGCFLESRMSLIHAETEGGRSYSIQYTCESIKELNQYMEEFAPKLQEDHNKKYNGRFAAFRTMLEVVDFKVK